MSRDRLQIVASKNGWRWRLVAGNGEILSTDEAYTRRRDAVRGAKRAHPRVKVKE